MLRPAEQALLQLREQLTAGCSRRVALRLTTLALYFVQRASGQSPPYPEDTDDDRVGSPETASLKDPLDGE